MKLSDQIQQLAGDEHLQQYPREPSNSDAHAQLHSLVDQTSQSQQLMLSGLWLLHGFLDESHSISQDSHTSEGSFWHAIMHRLEGDFWNSKYWYRRVGIHSAYDSISDQLSSVAGASEHFPNNQWDPEVFVDLCEQAAQDAELANITNQLARLEWQCLFDCCNH